MDANLSAAIDRRMHQGPLAWLVSRQTFWVFLAAVIACIALSLATDTFATERNLFNVTRNFAFVGIVALGMTAVIITARHRSVGGLGRGAGRHGRRHDHERRLVDLDRRRPRRSARRCWWAWSTAL